MQLLRKCKQLLLRKSYAIIKQIQFWLKNTHGIIKKIIQLYANWGLWERGVPLRYHYSQIHSVPVWVPSLSQIELFNHFLNLKPFNCQQTNYWYKNELLVLHSKFWKHLTVCKQMSSGSYKNTTNRLFVCKSRIYLIYVYQKNFALNNPQGLLCFKIQPNKQTIRNNYTII